MGEINPREEGFQRLYVKPVPGRALVVGSKVYEGRFDARKMFDDAIGIDMEPGDGVDIVADLEEPPPSGLGQFGHIMCGSVIEHSRRPWLLAANLERLLQPGGSIYVHAPTVWRFHGYPSDYWRFTHAGIAALFPCIRWEVMLYADHRGDLHKPPRIPVEEGGRWGKVQIHAFGHQGSVHENGQS